MDHTFAQPEFFRPLDVSDVPAEGLSCVLQATPEECQALCRRFDLEGLQALSAQILIAPARGPEGEPALRMEAEVRAEVTQICVVTLKPFRTQVVEAFAILFQHAAGQAGELPEDDFGDDAIELLESEEIDVGELVAQHMALSLDPHPRAPGAEWRGPGEGPDTANTPTPANGPFAKLGQLKHKM